MKFIEVIDIIVEKFNAKKNREEIREALKRVLLLKGESNKSHGDFFEIAFFSFIRKYVSPIVAKHTGKEDYRSKTGDENDIILAANEKYYPTVKDIFPLSVKAGYENNLQVRTDINTYAFNYCEQHRKAGLISANPVELNSLPKDTNFESLFNKMILHLHTNDKKLLYSVYFMDLQSIRKRIKFIKYVNKQKNGKLLKHPVYICEDKDGNYLCEIRYGNGVANALQRGIWTLPKKLKDDYKIFIFKDEPFEFDVDKLIKCVNNYLFNEI